MSKPQWSVFASRDELDVHLADTAVRLLDKGIRERGEAILVVSGGLTPLGFFHQLSSRELDWSRVVVTLADERWVDADHTDSNERLVRENLLTGAAAAARFVALKNDSPSAAEGVEQCQRQLASLGSIDLLVLGMGGDGHTASLFPGTATVAEGLNPDNPAAAVAVVPLMAAHERMSMTLSRLLNSQQIVVHITGPDKRAVLEQAMTIADKTLLPVSGVLQQQQTPVNIYWAD